MESKDNETKDDLISSSSKLFIIGKLKNDLKVEIKVEIDLEDCLNRKIENIEDLNKFFNIKHVNEIDSDEINRQYMSCMQVIMRGGEVLLIDIYNNSIDELELFLYQNGIKNIKFKDGIIVIRG